MIEKKSFYRIAFFSFLIILILAGSIYITTIQSKNTKNNIEFSEQSHLNILTRDLEQKLKEVSTDLYIFVNDFEMKTYLNNKSEKNCKSLSTEFLNYSKGLKTYNQIQFISSTGKEIFRIDFKHGKFFVVHKSELQNKRNQYYFKNTIKLSENQIYVSPFNLYVENGKIEKPFKLIIRFCTPVFNKNGKKEGILVLNYSGNTLLSVLTKEKHSDMIGTIMLLNQEGYFLKSENRNEEEFGFMFKDEQNFTFAKYYPEAWKIIKQNNKGNIITDKGLFTYTTFSPTNLDKRTKLANVNGMSAPIWKLVSRVSQNKLDEQYSSYKKFIIKLDLLLFSVIFIALFIFSRFDKQRKHQQIELKESEERFRTAFFTSPDSININRLEDGLYVDINQGFTKIIGYTETEVLGKSSLKLNIWIDNADREKLVAGLKLSGEVNNLEAQFKKKNGEIITGLISARIIDIHGVPHILSITRDISEIKETQNKLEESEQWHREIFEGSRDAIFIVDANAHFVDVNNAATELTGYSSNELLNMSIPDLHEESELSAYTNLFHLILEGKSVVSEAKILKKNGKKIETEFSNKRIIINNTTYVHTIAKDITERRKAEKELKLQEQELSLIYDSVLDIIYYLKVDEGKQYTFLSVNKAFLKATGLTEEQIIGKTIDQIIPEPSLQLVRNNYAKAIENKQTVQWEETSKYPSGIKTGIVSISPFCDKDGNCTNLIGSVHDITERKKMEVLLKESEERFKSLMMQSPFVVEIYDLSGLQISVNKAYEELWNFQAEITLNKFNVLESKEVVKSGLMEYIKRSYAGESVVVPEYRFDSTVDTAKGLGRVRWLSTRVYPLKDKLKNVKKLLGKILMTQDSITDLVVYIGKVDYVD